MHVLADNVPRDTKTSDLRCASTTSTTVWMEKLATLLSESGFNFNYVLVVLGNYYDSADFNGL